MVPPLRCEISDSIAEISLARPPVNALDLPLLDRLMEKLRQVGSDRTVRAVVLTSGLPGRFCAGLDLRALLDQSEAQVRRYLEKLYIELADVQYNLGKPSIAAVTGAARGGGMTLAISCDVLIAGESSTFGYPEIDLGLVPAIHFAHLPAIVGRHRAFELLFSGRSFGADEATLLGLVSRVAPDESVRAQALALARSFAAKSPAAVRLGRAAFMRANDYRRKIAEAVDVFCNAARSEEAQEGLRAFLDKRPPRWSGS
ncbi:MAG TPA: enoyl-CoA hydratase/isomerase family protein [Xanthobacteraceae bacterium]|jgi:enoyl-CoA hydratase/carnithine racemase